MAWTNYAHLEFNLNLHLKTATPVSRTTRKGINPIPSRSLTLYLPSMAEQLVIRGTLEGHSGWVTSLATSLENPNMLLSGSRDKTLIIWNLTRDDTHYGYPKRSLHGHSHIVSDCVCLSLSLLFSVHRSPYVLTDLCSKRSSPQTVPTLSPPPGTRPSACGSSQRV